LTDTTCPICREAVGRPVHKQVWIEREAELREGLDVRGDFLGEAQDHGTAADSKQQNN
jgi:hypothetical protein